MKLFQLEYNNNKMQSFLSKSFNESQATWLQTKIPSIYLLKLSQYNFRGMKLHYYAIHNCSTKWNVRNKCAGVFLRLYMYFTLLFIREIYLFPIFPITDFLNKLLCIKKVLKNRK